MCPTHAVIYGKRSDLLAEAHRRIEEKPGYYFEDRVYGETEGGGTQCLILAHVEYSNLGLPKMGPQSNASRVRRVTNVIYQGFLTPVVIYGGLVAIIRDRWKAHLGHVAHEREKQEGKESHA